MPMYPASTPHLNPFGCEIRSTEDKGRGVFATQPIPAQTTIDISPVLFFSKDEYERYGQYTALDHYTFKWRDGRMALALGLGSIFNHSSTPNVSYVLDTEHACIRFMTMRSIAPADELCIFYGSNLWFDDKSSTPTCTGEDSENEDLLVSLADLKWEQAHENPNELILEADLPFERVVVGEPEGNEDEASGVEETINAWAVDIPEPQQMAGMIQWLKQADLEHPSLKHAKHVRKRIDPETSTSRATLLLTLADSPPPIVPGGLDPYTVAVPRFPARTMDEVKLKATIWPVFYEAQNHRELQEESRRWTRATVQWFRDAVSVLRKEAKRVRQLGEIPVVSYVPMPFDAPPEESRSFIAHDTRTSSHHPLRHSVFNLVRLVGHAIPPPPSSSSTNLSEQNGQNYLLTSLTLFTTHEPCIACSMALLHSRVKEVVYLYAMPQTGGCGGVTCVPGLKGINHRFKIWKWRGLPAGAGGGVQGHIDA